MISGTPINSEANNFAQQVGAFEVVADKRDPSNHVLQQMSLQAPVHWCPLAMTQPITYFGNFNWWVDLHFCMSDGLLQDCYIFIANALETLRSGEVLLKTQISCLYKFMFILPVMKDHLSWETTKLSVVTSYWFHCNMTAPLAIIGALKCFD